MAILCFLLELLTTACDMLGHMACVAGEAFWKVVLPTAFALVLCNMDRICMAVAIIPMAKEFGWAPGVQVGPSRSISLICDTLSWASGARTCLAKICMRMHDAVWRLHQGLNMLIMEE